MKQPTRRTFPEAAFAAGAAVAARNFPVCQTKCGILPGGIRHKRVSRAPHDYRLEH